MWLVLSFLTAFFISLQDIISKRVSKGVSPYVIAWAVSFFAVPCLAIFFLFQRPIITEPAAFWPALLSSSLILAVASIFFFKSIEASDLSLTIPLLSFTPLLLLITSPIILGEFPRPLGIVGMVFIVMGCYALYYRRGQENFWAPFERLVHARGSRYMLIVSILYSIGGNIDKIGMRSSSPLVWSISLHAVVAVLLGMILLVRVKNAESQIRAHWPWLVAVGVCMACAMMAQMHAIQLAIVPYVIAIKRTSIIMTALWGVWFLKEKDGGERIMAVLLMIVGVLVISFAH